MKQATSWGSTWEGGAKGRGNRGGGDWGDDDWGAIPEEDEEEEDYDDGWDDLGDEADDGYGEHDRHRRVRHPDISYHLQTPNEGSVQHGVGGGPPPPAPGPARVQELMHMDPHKSSKTMNLATGRESATVFDLTPPRQSNGETAFHFTRGEALKLADRALYAKTRKARERIHWLFPPSGDPRVVALMKWIDAMSSGLANIGVSTGIPSAVFSRDI